MSSLWSPWSLSSVRWLAVSLRSFVRNLPGRHRRHGVSGLDRIPGGEKHLIPFDNVATLACSWCTVARICFEGLNYILCARMWSECQHSRYHPFDRNGVPLLSRSGRCFCASARSGNFAPQTL